MNSDTFPWSANLGACLALGVGIKTDKLKTEPTLKPKKQNFVFSVGADFFFVYRSTNQFYFGKFGFSHAILFPSVFFYVNRKPSMAEMQLTNYPKSAKGERSEIKKSNLQVSLHLR